MTFTKLLEPTHIAAMTLKNRLVFPATSTNLSTRDGYLTDREKAFQIERAKGGTGLVIVPGYVHPSGRSFPNVAGIWEDGQVEGWRDLAGGIQAHGARACVQLMHAGRYVHHSLSIQPVAASAVPPRIPRYTPARELGLAEIGDMVRSYGQAARRAKEAGFEALEVLACTGYLVSTFISRWANRRTDQYGGSMENRARFLLEIIREVKAQAPGLALLVRLNAEDQIPGGTPREELLQVGRMCQEAGVDAISLTVGWHESSDPAITSEIPIGNWLPLAIPWKKALTVPIIMAYRLRTPQMAEKALQEGYVDLVAMCRPLIADPEMAIKLSQERADDVIPCITCNQGCFQRLFNTAWVQCLMNPRTGRESLDEYRLEPAASPKRVLVVGGGPAGMEAARVAAQRGHRVVLCERSGRLGGQASLAAAPPYREELGEIVSYLSHQLVKLGVEVRMNTEVTASLVRDISPDAIIVATGAAPRMPDVSLSIPTVTAHQVLAGEATVGQRVLVWGGDETGAQTAEYLAVRGRQVTLLEESARLAKDMTSFDRVGLKVRLGRLGVRTLMRATMEEVSAGHITISGPEGTEEIEVDTLVVSLGMIPNQALFQELRGQHPEVYAVGDCVNPRKALHAIHEGFRAATQL